MKKLIKALGLKKIASLFNFTYTIKLNHTTFRVPVINGLGIHNLTLKEDWISNLIKQIDMKEQDVFVDVGVNIGQTLMAFRSCCQNPYIGFEPNPSCLYYLRNLVKINDMKEVTIIPVGLSTESSLVKLYSKTDTDSAATIVHNLRPGFYNANHSDFIPAMKFDELKDIIPKDANISFVKVDVEGAELNVLMGMQETLKKHKPIVVCEVLDYHALSSATETQEKADKLSNFMQDLGYYLFKIDVKENKIGFEETITIKLVQWSANSINANDYFFIHKDSNKMSIAKG